MILDYETRHNMVALAIREFPRLFGLRAFPGKTFRISPSASYVNDSNIVMLYTEVLSGENWLSFAKGTASELWSNITANPNETEGTI